MKKFINEPLIDLPEHEVDWSGMREGVSTGNVALPDVPVPTGSMVAPEVMVPEMPVIVPIFP
ncbi:hypothetical protein E3E12_07820 [Formicincola oecophyllae]|uniref:Uncharacterized protein n=1 Tax=Formicincola oecophyllae TaxID=2558361 RepID=A0A4Y6U9F6_9PROT|nr:hypothetical protein [Formicincola oecophyllae]QDH14103.1 hypothetical protein E3E12_07820 [Formicincola oecophyllae]